MVDFPLPKGPGAQGPGEMEELREVSKGSFLSWSDGFFSPASPAGLAESSARFLFQPPPGVCLGCTRHLHPTRCAPSPRLNECAAKGTINPSMVDSDTSPRHPPAPSPHLREVGS